MGHRHPELLPLELLPLEPVADGTEPTRFGRHQVIEREQPRWVRGLVHALTRGLAWLATGRRPDQIGSEFTVRRRIHGDLATAVPAVIAAIPAARGSGPDVVPARRRSARLELRLEDARNENGVLRIPGRLRGAWLPRPVPVEIDVEPWSAGQCELRLQARRRHGDAHPSQRYFDAAHDVLDVLRAAAEAHMAPGFRAPAS